MSGCVIAIGMMFAGCVAVCLFIWRYREKRMSKAYQSLLQRLDRAIGGEIQDTAYDESMDAAVTERLNRVVRIEKMYRERIEQERDAVKSLIADISHQVRTPLTNMMLYAGLLQEKQLGRAEQALADKIITQSEKLDFFMKELVKSAYMEQEMIAIHPEFTDAEEMIDLSCQLVELTAMKKSIQIVRSGVDVRSVHGTKCYADKRWTVEALGNVLENAVKYSPEASQIAVRVISYDSFVCIQVQDEGIGIREEEQGLIFERFYRSKEVSSQPGFGIGLYLVREVLARQGGYVKVRSQIGEGTIVQLFLSTQPVTAAF